MSDVTETFRVAIADRYGIERDLPALKGGLGATRRVLKDAIEYASGHVVARRAAPSRDLSPGTTRGGA